LVLPQARGDKRGDHGKKTTSTFKTMVVWNIYERPEGLEHTKACVTGVSWLGTQCALQVRYHMHATCVSPCIGWEASQQAELRCGQFCSTVHSSSSPAHPHSSHPILPRSSLPFSLSHAYSARLCSPHLLTSTPLLTTHHHSPPSTGLPPRLATRSSKFWPSIGFM
jgi:hypothetical protein